MTLPLILVVDDDPHLREVVRFALEKAGFEIAEAGDGRAALASITARMPALIVLDVNMPEMDGFECCRVLRRSSHVPVLFLSSRDEEVDRIIGLEIGGDDYLTKPFSPRELTARVKAVLRRTQPQSAQGQELRTLINGRLALDLDRYEARWGEAVIVLTATEFGFLRTLLQHPGRVYTRDELMEHGYEGGNLVADRTIDSHVRRLRRKFGNCEADPIETVHGIGYRLGPCT